MKPVVMRKQRIVMFPCSEHERYVKRQVEYLPTSQVRKEYGPDLTTGLGSYAVDAELADVRGKSTRHIPALIELVDKGTLGFARAKISGVTWILCRQYDQNPWQAVCCIAKSGESACGEPVKEEKPEVKAKTPQMSAKLRRELAREHVRSALRNQPTVQLAQAMGAIAGMVQPPRGFPKRGPMVG